MARTRSCGVLAGNSLFTATTSGPLANMATGARSLTGSKGILACTAAFVVDRKSTRLNSSHLVISYAVFCLKKKKNSDLRGYIFIDLYCDRAYYSLHSRYVPGVAA